MTIGFTQILEARKRIAGHVLRTPLREASGLAARAGVPVWLKCEHQQTTGSFKLRGASNAILSLDRGQRKAGVVAASTGNHGRALAFAARRLGVRAIICMSALVPANKVAAIEALGAEVHIVGTSQDDAQAEAARTNADLARIRDLYGQGVYAKARLDQAVAAARAADAQVAAARAQQGASVVADLALVIIQHCPIDDLAVPELVLGEGELQPLQPQHGVAH